MNAIRRIVICWIILFAGLFSACGTFEIGLENPAEDQVNPIEPSSTISVEPNVEVIESTPTPFDEDELFIRGALAHRLGTDPESLQFTITENTGRHAKGNVSNGYFLAVKDQGNWMILYDGQGTPYCQPIEGFQVPVEMVPECLDVDNNLVFRSETINPAAGDLDCEAGSAGAIPGSAENIACSIRDGLLSRNISTLSAFMADPFMLGFYQSEGVMYSPAEMIEQLPKLYNFNSPDYYPRLTFTTDRDLFPAVEGILLDEMFGPDVDIVLVIYSQGWGTDGKGGSLLFFTQDDQGNIVWYGMIYSGNDFSA